MDGWVLISLVSWVLIQTPFFFHAMLMAGWTGVVRKVVVFWAWQSNIYLLLLLLMKHMYYYLKLFSMPLLCFTNK